MSEEVYVPWGGGDVFIPWWAAEIERLTAILSLHMPATVTVSLDSGGPNMPLNIALPDSATHTATASYTNADGSAYTGPTDGFALSWSTDNPAVVNLDTTAGTFTATGADGTANIIATVVLPDGVAITGSDSVIVSTVAPPPPPPPPLPTGVTVTLT